MIGKRKAALPARPRIRRRAIPTLRRAGRWAAIALLAALCYGGFALNRSPAGQTFLAAAAERAIVMTAGLGLVVGDIEVEGRETTDASTIMAALAAERGTPIFAISPTRAKAQLEALPWVRSAAIERRLPDTILVRLVERHPLAVWQHGGKQELIDREGEVIPVTDQGRFARLPMVVGEHAATHARGLLDMLSSEPELAARVNAAILVDDRRWTLRVDHAIDVLLPEENPEAAWSRLAELERTKSLLQRDIQTVDMRLPDRLVLRAVAAPAKEAAPAAKKIHSPAGKAT